MTPWDIMRELYASEINASVESDWDGGITAWVGHPTAAKRTFLKDEIDLIAHWMDDEERRLFPESAYAQAPDLTYSTFSAVTSTAPRPNESASRKQWT